MESAVAQLKKGGGGAGYEVHGEQRYAELWMGTHPSGPSRVLPTHEGESPVLLRDYLQVRLCMCVRVCVCVALRHRGAHRRRF